LISKHSRSYCYKYDHAKKHNMDTHSKALEDGCKMEQTESCFHSDTDMGWLPDCVLGDYMEWVYSYSIDNGLIIKKLDELFSYYAHSPNEVFEQLTKFDSTNILKIIDNEVIDI
jgi:hypothetical protein